MPATGKRRLEINRRAKKRRQLRLHIAKAYRLAQELSREDLRRTMLGLDEVFVDDPEIQQQLEEPTIHEFLDTLNRFMQFEDRRTVKRLQEENFKLKKWLVPELETAFAEGQGLGLVAPFDARLPCPVCQEPGVLYKGTVRWFMVHDSDWDDSNPQFQIHDLGTKHPKNYMNLHMPLRIREDEETWFAAFKKSEIEGRKRLFDRARSTGRSTSFGEPSST